MEKYRSYIFLMPFIELEGANEKIFHMEMSEILAWKFRIGVG